MYFWIGFSPTPSYILSICIGNPVASYAGGGDTTSALLSLFFFFGSLSLISGVGYDVCRSSGSHELLLFSPSYPYACGFMSCGRCDMSVSDCSGDVTSWLILAFGILLFRRVLVLM